METFSLLQTETSCTKKAKKIFNIGFISSPNNYPLLITPKIVKTLIAKNMTVYIQRNYGKNLGIENIEYADCGAEIIDNALNIIHLSNIILKSAPPTEQEFEAIDKNKILFSSIDLNVLTKESIFHLIQNKITAFALNHITDMENKAIIENICKRSLELHGTIHHLSETEKIATFLLSLIEFVTAAVSLRELIATSPYLMKSIYCIEGQICQQGVAEIAQISWKDILQLSWNWN